MKRNRTYNTQTCTPCISDFCFVKVNHLNSDWQIFSFVSVVVFLFFFVLFCFLFFFLFCFVLFFFHQGKWTGEKMLVDAESRKITNWSYLLITHKPCKKTKKIIEFYFIYFIIIFVCGGRAGRKKGRKKKKERKKERKKETFHTASRCKIFILSCLNCNQPFHQKLQQGFCAKTTTEPS